MDLLRLPVHLMDVFTGVARLGDWGIEKKMMGIVNGIYKTGLGDMPQAEANKGVAFKVGDFTVFGALDEYGYEIGYRLINASFVISRGREKLFGFRRDGIEYELAGTKECFIALGGWEKSFLRLANSGSVERLDLEHDFGSISGNRPGLGTGPHIAQMMFEAHCKAQDVMNGIMRRNTGSKPANQ